MDFQSTSCAGTTPSATQPTYFVSGLSVLATILVIIPLIAILFYLVYKAQARSTLPSSQNLRLLSASRAEAWRMPSSARNYSGLASLMGIPIGIAAGVYLAEFGRGKPFATAVRFNRGQCSMAYLRS